MTTMRSLSFKYFASTVRTKPMHVSLWTFEGRPPTLPDADGAEDEAEAGKARAAA